jgi:phage terminase large subunit-like protein
MHSKNLTAASLASLSPAQRSSLLQTLSEEEREALDYHWEFWARPTQLPPAGDWIKWLILAGRGWGKTRVGAETVRSWMCGDTPLTGGKFSRVAIVAETSADARLVIVEGESGLLRIHPPAFRPHYHTSKRQLTWPNGSIATLYNATEPDQLRGPQHQAAWCDELAKWQYVRDTWDMLQFGLRLGERPLQVITTTPRPIPVLKEIIASPGTSVTRGVTSDNFSNLAPSFLQQIMARYQGTRLGRQELNAEILDDNPNALWKREQLDKLRVPKTPELARVVVAIDPSGTAGGDEGSADVGIVAAGRGVDGKCYILADATCNMSPAGWGRRAIETYRRFDADRIVAERNYGGAMVKHVIRTTDPNVPYKEVTASRGKWVRAEPVAALYEQGRVFHIGGFSQLEDEMCSFGPDGLSEGMSPNRVDALVWAVTELMLAAVPVPPVQGHYGRGSR